MEIISFIVVLVVVVLVFRAVGSWMLRIDEVIKNQKIIIQELKKSNENKA
jgi:hypothetical protein